MHLAYGRQGVAAKYDTTPQRLNAIRGVHGRPVCSTGGNGSAQRNADPRPGTDAAGGSSPCERLEGTQHSAEPARTALGGGLLVPLVPTRSVGTRVVFWI